MPFKSLNHHRLSFAPRALLLVALLFFAAFSGASAKPQPDSSHLEDPLYKQVTDRIKAKVSARLGKTPLSKDRFFIIPFAYENRVNDPAFSHSFITVIRVFADGKQRRPNPEFTSGTYKGWRFEAYTISWLPADFPENPNLCVFSGFGARLVPQWNQCPLSPGKSFNLEQTMKLAANAKVAVCMWGPYEIAKPAFDLGVKRKRLLDAGTIKYRADDRLYRQPPTAINCFHAIGSLDQPYPDGGAFGTGFKMWGLNGTDRVLREYCRKSNEGMLLEKVDPENDRYGFIYAPPDAKRPYNPFVHASAYQR